MNTFRKGLQDGVPIGLGYLSVSLTFGIMAVSNGFTVWQAVLISMFNLTSAGQFAGITVMAGAGSLIEMALTQFVINLRYALMSLSLTQKVDESFKIPQRLFFGSFHTDEIYAVAVGQKEKFGVKYFAGLTVAPYIGWTLGTLIGAVLGAVLPAMIANALSVALYGMFIAIVIPEMKKSLHMTIIVLLAVSMKFTFSYVPFLKDHVSEGFAIIICAVTASLVGALCFPLKEEDGMPAKKEAGV
ncbi:MAG: AzlC family ABC transporter permease [Lachnospiraceae bacterium]|nr:AzlC family ABC transporter permease [Lachnospiraceae bacterium]